MSALPDVASLASALIRCNSVTPEEGGALTLLERWLKPLGFACHRLKFEEAGFAPVENLYARRGGGGANFCFAGHTDVVPVGDRKAWRFDPFGGEVIEGAVCGRGAVDMKGAIAAFVKAAEARIAEGYGGSISLLITGDEEAEAVNGTRKVLAWMRERGESIDDCLVGEPTSGERLGDTVKIGRRGSLNGELTILGVQGHTAYPQLADNPLHRLVRMLRMIAEEPLDSGNAHFEPSNLQLTSVDVGNPASNVIPAEARARFNVRYNDRYDSRAIERWIRERLDAEGGRYELSIRVSGESFLCPPGPLSDLVAGAVKKVADVEPKLGTGGGTSDARFIKDHARVAELGLKNALAHKIDERVKISELERLEAIYRAVLDGYFVR